MRARITSLPRCKGSSPERRVTTRYTLCNLRCGYSLRLKLGFRHKFRGVERLKGYFVLFYFVVICFIVFYFLVFYFVPFFSLFFFIFLCSVPFCSVSRVPRVAKELTADTSGSNAAAQLSLGDQCGLKGDEQNI